MISVVATNRPCSFLAIPSCQISGIEIHATGATVLRTRISTKLHIKSNFEDMQSKCPEMKRSRTLDFWKTV